jgi:hypothetical protein
LDVLRIRRLPFLTRRNFLREFQQLMFWSVFVGVVEGQFASVVVAKSFQAGNLMIAIASAGPFAAYIVSLAWGLLSVGRPKVRLGMTFGFSAAVCAAVIGFIPPTSAGAIWFIVQIFAAQAFLAGVVTVRSAIWKSNYPFESRGQIAARLQQVRSLISVVTVQIAAAVCDVNPHAYRFVFPVAAASAAIGMCLFSRVRIRGERSELRRLALNASASGKPAHGAAYTLLMALSPRHALREVWIVLRDDKRFTWYCVAQTLHGISNLLTIPIVIAVVTRHLHAEGRYGFWISAGLIIGLPTLTLLGSLNRWGRLFDSLQVLRFRVVNVLCWIIALLFGMFGTIVVMNSGDYGPRQFMLAVALFACRGIIYGTAQAGGSLAWNIGHLHFAEGDRAEVYMGIHVFLTGLRGLAAPLGGMWLWNMIGWPVWLIAIGFGVSAVVIYGMLARFEGSTLDTPHVA